jgi:hypothetical protein
LDAKFYGAGLFEEAGIPPDVEAGMFRLTKWYLDAVGEDGTAFIGYAAHLRWGALRVRYRAVLLALPNESATETFTLRTSPDPLVEEGGVVRWSCLPLRLQGVWTPRCAPVRRTLFASQAGDVVWECLAPAATVDMTLSSLRMTASGYVERLTMTAPPWALGLDQLHWGRFISESSNIVWLDWRGPGARRVVLWNGEEMPDAVVHEHHIVLTPGNRLDLGLSETAGETQSRILREGRLVNIIDAVPGLKDAVPRWLGEGHEVKRLSRTRLQSNDLPAGEGWAIHEVVTWRSNVPV